MATLHPLLQRQPQPFPRYEPLSEEKLEDKGIVIQKHVNVSS